MSRTIVTGSELMKFHARHLARSKWRFFATLAFRRSNLSPSMANRRFESWICDIQEIEDEEMTSEEDFLWFRVHEQAAFPQKPLFHVLLAGLDASQHQLTKCWKKRGGDVKATQIVQSQDAWAFIFSVARNGQKFEIKHDLLR